MQEPWNWKIDLIEDLLGYCLKLYVGGTLVNLPDFRIPVIFFDRVLPGVPVASEQFERLRHTPPADYLEIEQFSSLYLDGVDIRIKLDCATKENSRTVIWDWKTGKKEADTGLSIQMGCYALYARNTFRAKLDEIVTRRFDLNRGVVHEHTLTESSLGEILAYVRGSIADMRALLENEADNTVDEERFTKVEKRNVCLKCNFLKVCKPNI